MSLISRLLEPAPCSAQPVWVLVPWTLGAVAAAVAMRLEGERRYERRAVSAAAVPASPPARAKRAAQRPRARKTEGK